MVKKTTPQGTSIKAPAADSANTGIMPEFLRCKDACRLFGIGKSTLADWITRGFVKSHLVRRKGNVSGIRLVSTAHLREWIENGGEA